MVSGEHLRQVLLRTTRSNKREAPEPGVQEGRRAGTHQSAQHAEQRAEEQEAHAVAHQRGTHSDAEPPNFTQKEGRTGRPDGTGLRARARLGPLHLRQERPSTRIQRSPPVSLGDAHARTRSGDLGRGQREPLEPLERLKLAPSAPGSRSPSRAATSSRAGGAPAQIRGASETRTPERGKESARAGEGVRGAARARKGSTCWRRWHLLRGCACAVGRRREAPLLFFSPAPGFKTAAPEKKARLVSPPPPTHHHHPYSGKPRPPAPRLARGAVQPQRRGWDPSSQSHQKSDATSQSRRRRRGAAGIRVGKETGRSEHNPLIHGGRAGLLSSTPSPAKYGLLFISLPKVSKLKLEEENESQRLGRFHMDLLSIHPASDVLGFLTFCFFIIQPKQAGR
ncbi:hypothetical protein AOLI_G00103940 [Acnodon oligacanthus]